MLINVHHSKDTQATELEFALMEKKVTQSNQISFILDRVNNGVHLMASSCTMEKQKSIGGSVMVWLTLYWETLSAMICVAGSSCIFPKTQHHWKPSRLFYSIILL